MELSSDVQPLSLPLAHVIIDNKLKTDRQGKPVMIILFIFTLLLTVGAALNDMLPVAAGSAVVMVLFFWQVRKLGQSTSDLLHAKSMLDLPGTTVEYHPATNASLMKVLSAGEVLLQLPLSQERYVELLTQTNPMV